MSIQSTRQSGLDVCEQAFRDFVVFSKLVSDLHAKASWLVSASPQL